MGVEINDTASMDLMISPTALSSTPKLDSAAEKEEQAGLVPSRGISAQKGSHPTAHRPLAVKHVYAFPILEKRSQPSDIPSVGRHLPTTALYDTINVLTPLLVM